MRSWSNNCERSRRRRGSPFSPPWSPRLPRLHRHRERPHPLHRLLVRPPHRHLPLQRRPPPRHPSRRPRPLRGPLRRPHPRAPSAEIDTGSRRRHHADEYGEFGSPGRGEGGDWWRGRDIASRRLQFCGRWWRHARRYRPANRPSSRSKQMRRVERRTTTASSLFPPRRGRAPTPGPQRAFASILPRGSSIRG